MGKYIQHLFSCSNVVWIAQYIYMDANVEKFKTYNISNIIKLMGDLL